MIYSTYAKSWNSTCTATAIRPGIILRKIAPNGKKMTIARQAMIPCAIRIASAFLMSNPRKLPNWLKPPLPSLEEPLLLPPPLPPYPP
jgi:hypothetical protein